RFAREQQVNAESGNRVRDLEKQLSQVTTDWGRAKVEWEKQAKEHEHAESSLRQELESARAATKQTETAHNDAQARCGKLEEELTGLQNAREQLKASFEKELRTSAELANRIKELENDLSRRAGEFEKQVAERAQVESDLRRQLEAAGVVGKETE